MQKSVDRMSLSELRNRKRHEDIQTTMLDLQVAKRIKQNAANVYVPSVPKVRTSIG